MHLKTNNRNVAARITLPESIYDIINCNPFHVFLKVLARNLICWDAIAISKEFLADSNTRIVNFLYQNNYQTVFAHF